MIILDNNKTKRITVRLNDRDYEYLALKSADEDKPLAQLVRELIKSDKKENDIEVQNNGSIS